MTMYRVTLKEDGEIESLNLLGFGLLERGVSRDIDLTEAQAKSRSLKVRGVKVVKKAEKPAPKTGKG